MNLRILAWAINEDVQKMEESCAPLLETAAVQGVAVELFGTGVKFVEHKQRVSLLRDFLADQNEKEDTIFVCMDGADTLLADGEETLLERFLHFETRILISAERDFVHQYEIYRDHFEAIESPYRYVNAGTFMGFGDALLEMLEEMLEIDQRQPGNDQRLLGIWAHRNLKRTAKMKLDCNCEVFWVTTRDWEQILSERGFARIRNSVTNTTPVIVHGIGGRDPGTKMEKAFRRHYDAIIASSEGGARP